MSDERTEEAAALLALDLLEDADQRALESRLPHDAALRRLVSELRATAAGLALLAPTVEPSAALRDRVLASVAGRAAAVAPPRDRTDGSAPPPPAPTPFRLPPWLGWAAAACLALTAGLLGTLYWETRTALQSERDATRLAELERQALATELETERLLAAGSLSALRQTETQLASLRENADVARLKIELLASLLGDTPEARAIAVWHPNQQQGVLEVESLPALAADQDYQLWVVDPRYENPVDGGVFRVDPATGHARVEFRPNQPVLQVAKFAVTRERRGGVPKAEGPFVLLSD